MAEIGRSPVLLTTTDHPLLTAGLVDEFCRRSLASGADITIGLAPYQRVRERFPGMRKTVLRFRDGDYCGCNLFTFLSARGQDAAAFWKSLEGERKRPLKLISMLGWRTLLRYRLGKLALNEALDLLSEKMGVRVSAVILDHGEAAVDVDTVDDYRLVDERFTSPPSHPVE